MCECVHACVHMHVCVCVPSSLINVTVQSSMFVMFLAENYLSLHFSHFTDPKLVLRQQV